MSRAWLDSPAALQQALFSCSFTAWLKGNPVLPASPLRTPGWGVPALFQSFVPLEGSWSLSSGDLGVLWQDPGVGRTQTL